MTFDEINERLNELSEKGFTELVNHATKRARLDAKFFIARTHPKTAFGGQQMGTNQFIRGKYKIRVGDTLTNIYANYFARWYNTGAFGRAIRANGKRKGMRGTKYPPRGNYFANNKKAIEDYYATCIDKYLDEGLKRLDTQSGFNSLGR